jgi:alpha-L-fucosidase
MGTPRSRDLTVQDATGQDRTGQDPTGQDPTGQDPTGQDLTVRRLTGRNPGWWDHRRFGLLVHASAAAVPAWAPVGQYAEWYRAHLDGNSRDVLLHPSPMVETLAHHQDRWAHVEHFEDFEELLTFDEFDPDAWAQLAVDAGMSYTVMVAKHHDGLCWWDAPGTEHTTLHRGPRRNVLAEYASACERTGIVFGTYYSLLDWSAPGYPGCSYVDDIVHPHVLDLVERYGSKMLWGDGHWGGGGSLWRSDDLIAAARRIDPTVIANDRWWADGPGVRSFEYRLPDGIVAEPWEMRRGLGASFSHNRAEQPVHLLAPDDIVALLTEVIAKGGHLLLSVGPDARGRIPAEQVDRLSAAGEWVHAHRDLVDRGEPWEQWGDERCRYIVLDGELHVVDVAGRGEFAALVRSHHRVRAVHRDDEETGNGEAIGFEQDGRGLRIDPRRAGVARRGGDRVRVYRVTLEPTAPAPIELFASAPPPPLELAGLLAGAQPGQIVQLGEGVYVGPARVPDGVTVRGLGPDRTTIDGVESVAVSLGAGSRIEHCTLRGGGDRIVWLPRFVARLGGAGGVALGCRIDGHVDVAADDCRVTSCTLTGVVARNASRVTVARSTFSGMNWDTAIDIAGGAGHLVESNELSTVLEAIRLTRTIGAEVRGNQVRARWWGVRLVDTETTLVVANAFEATMRSVDVDGGALAEVTGNSVVDGDSGCIVQRGASEIEISGNHWQRTRIGLLAWDAGHVRVHDNIAVDLTEPDRIATVGP